MLTGSRDFTSDPPPGASRIKNMQLLSGLLLLFCICVSEVNSLSHVPVLLWSTERFTWGTAPTINAGHITSSNEFYHLLQQDDRKTRFIVMFLQDTLNIDDFTYYSTAYGTENPLFNVQKILDSSPTTLILPSVEKKAVNNLPSYLNQQDDWNIVSVDNFNVSSLELDHNKPNLIIIRLQSIPRSNKDSAAMVFTENDKQIGRITHELKDRGFNFTAIYTGIKPSKVVKSFDMVYKRGRELLATDTSISYSPLNVTNGSDVTCILIYATQFYIRVNKSLELDLTNVTFQVPSANTNLSDCSATNTTLSLLYSLNEKGLSSLEIRFYMTNTFYPGSARNWFKLESVMLIPDQDMLRNASFYTTYASAPAEYSYHCQQIGTSSAYGERLVPSNKEATNWEIFISEFQIQGFNIKNNQFSYASDCTSFFTPAIWMGLVSSIILLWILSYGIFMIMQLTTNDKFDDPKSQPLSVPQGE
ncbi:V-type proton ATPase subunit S1-like [Dendropsophus ebraccatus]|uniref:V-type proton ATPase subunit S1-like n=1 Tax=Dendropsophus ebraccatus TaxID=150705 RepID=UPI003831D794